MAPLRPVARRSIPPPGQLRLFHAPRASALAAPALTGSGPPIERPSSGRETQVRKRLVSRRGAGQHGRNRLIAIQTVFLEARMRKLMIICGLVLLGAGSAKAQENRGFEVSGNYQYVRLNPGGG